MEELYTARETERIITAIIISHSPYIIIIIISFSTNINNKTVCVVLVIVLYMVLCTVLRIVLFIVLSIYVKGYRRTSFKCEHVIIANCDFSPSVQLLEHNVYITHSINQCVARA